MLDTVVVYQALLWGTRYWNWGFGGGGETGLENFSLPLFAFGWQPDALEVMVQHDERGPWDPDALAFGEWCPGRQAVQTA